MPGPLHEQNPCAGSLGSRHMAFGAAVCHEAGACGPYCIVRRPPAPESSSGNGLLRIDWEFGQMVAKVTANPRCEFAPSAQAAKQAKRGQF